MINVGSNKVIFLAGPIRDAPQWQVEAFKLLQKYNFDGYVAAPVRSLEINLPFMVSNELFPRQLKWEQYYLKRASIKGCILFWLPLRKTFKFKKAYARDTFGELGEWRGRSMCSNCNIVIGGEDEFDGFDMIKRNYQAHSPSMKFYNSLEDTIKAAIKKSELI